MGEHYIDPHWLFDDSEDADNTSMVGADQEPELVEEPQQEWDASDELDEGQAQWAEELSLVEEMTQDSQGVSDEFLLDGVIIQTDMLATHLPPATGPLTRRLAEVNASRPLRSAPITLQLDEHTPLTLETLLTDGGQRKASSRSGSRRSGCSLVAALLVLLCLSSIATLVWSGIWPSFPNPLAALGGGSHVTSIHTTPTSAGTAVLSTATGAPLGGVGATPSSTSAGTGSSPTPTSLVGPTATIGPYAQSATITFAAATQTLSSPSSLSACPSGCAISATMDTPSRSFLHSQHTSGGSAY